MGKIKIFLISFILLIAIYSNFMNKHKVIKLTQKIDKKVIILQSMQEINQDLLAKNSKLLSRDRIKKLASEELGMFFSSAAPTTITENNEKDPYRIINFLIPTADALNN